MSSSKEKETSHLESLSKDNKFKLESANSNNHFIKKCSIFDLKLGKKLIDSITEVVEGFENDFLLNQSFQNEERSKDKTQSKIGLDFIYLYEQF